MKKGITGVLLCVCSLAASAQVRSTCQVYGTVESSQQWMEQTQKLPIKAQLAAIQQRIQCDAQVRDESKENGACFTGVSTEGRERYEEQRQVELAQDKRPHGYTLLYFIDGQPMDMTNPVSYERLQKVKVKTIKFLTSRVATAIYGSRGALGVVAISTKKRS